jgi:hypothetical protein
VGCVFAKCIPQQVPAQQPETNDKCAERIPILYVPLPIATASLVGSGNARVVVEGRDWPCFAANHRKRRKLSHSVAKHRDRPSAGLPDKKKKIAVPTPPRHFLIKRGIFSWIERRGRPVTRVTERFLSRSCSAIPLQSMGSIPGSTRALPQNGQDVQNFLSGKPFAIPLSVERSFTPNEALCQAIQKFYRPATPLPFPL